MRSRRVPVLKLGSRGPGGDARSLRCVRKAFAKRPQSVRKASAKRPQAFASVRGGSDMPERRKRRKSSRNVKLSSLFTFRLTKVSTVTGIAGGRGRETQNCRHFWTRLVSPCLNSVNSHRDRGGSWSRNPELSSLLDSSRLSVSQQSQQSQGSRGVVVAKPRAVVTFGLVSGLRVSKVSTVTGIAGGRGRETQNCRHFWTRLVFAFQKCQQSQGSRGVVVAKPRTVVTFGLASGERRGEERGERRKER